MFHNNKLLIIMIMILVSILGYNIAKNLLLYHPIAPNPIKYQNFYLKISNLIDSEDNHQNFTIPTSDGIYLDTCYIKNPNSDMCIIFFHGETGNISMMFNMVKFLYSFGSIVIFDYRTYGKSTGYITDVSSNGFNNDANAIWDYVRNKLKYPADRISLFGESLGCSIVIKLASQISKTFNKLSYPHSIILNSPFYSLSSLFNTKSKNLDIDFLNPFINLIETEYDSSECIKYINHFTKIIIAHSLDNETIPYSEGIKLFDSIVTHHPNVKFINITGKHDQLGLTDDYIYSVSDILQE